MEKKRRREEEEANVDVAPEVVLVEPFYSGSHQQLVDLLATQLLEAQHVPYALVMLPGRKWHWRLMASSLSFAMKIPRNTSRLRVLFVTSMVNLAELLGLRADLNQPQIKKVYYFHENQLTYPFQTATNASDQQRKVAAEDFQIGWAQILSCVVADDVVFNSDYNRTSFLSKVDSFIRKIPEQDLRVPDLAAQIQAKSSVLYFPLTIECIPKPQEERDGRLTILWNHRWEYDKNPDEFFQVLFELDDNKIPFRLIVLGESFQASPPIFQTAKERFERPESSVEIVQWGYASSRDHYLELLRAADVVISTSHHEFYGVAVLEAVMGGCFPLVPNRLVYPEFFTNKSNIFNTSRQLFKQLKYLCKNPSPARKFYQEYGQSFEKFHWNQLAGAYRNLLGMQSAQTRQK